MWLVYVRLLTVRLVTEVRDRELKVALRGCWRLRRVLLAKIASLEVIKFDPIQDYGGYEIRSTREGQAYIGSKGQRIRVN